MLYTTLHYSTLVLSQLRLDYSEVIILENYHTSGSRSLEQPNRSENTEPKSATCPLPSTAIPDQGGTPL